MDSMGECVELSRGTIAEPTGGRHARHVASDAGTARERRRRLGSFYTPMRLVDHLLDAALSPLLTALPLPRVLDPAVGDGVFLVGAADRIARALDGTAPPLSPEERAKAAPRCLTGVDVDATALDQARARLSERGADADLILGDFLSDPPPTAGPFDLVAGNPPWGGWDRSLAAARRKDLRERFATARGRIDPFALFLERCTELLAPGGRLAMVLPDYFLLKNYPAARRLVLDRYRIEELARWGMAFPGVNLDACTIVAVRRPVERRARARPSGGGHRVRCLPEGPGGRSLSVPQSRFEKAPGHVFNLSLDARAAALLGRLERTGIALGRLVESHEGIHSGNVRDKLFVPPGAPGDRLRGLILGRDEIVPYRLRPVGWRVAYDRALIDRSRGEYANLGRERWFAAPKLLVRRTGDRVVAAIDRRGLFASNNLFVVRPRAACPVSMEYLLAYLNSSLATWCFRAIQPRTGRLFAELKLVHLNRLPVPIPRGVAGALETARLASLARRLRRADDAEARATVDEVFGRLARLTTSEARRVAQGAGRPVGRNR